MPHYEGGNHSCCWPYSCSNRCVDNWLGDAYCDDLNNNMNCNYDEGDCCGCNVITDYCEECLCIDPNANGAGTTCSPVTSLE